jgi:hypothetical protein
MEGNVPGRCDARAPPQRRKQKGVVKRGNCMTRSRKRQGGDATIVVYCSN